MSDPQLNSQEEIEQGVHYERIREKLRHSRSRQFGLGTIFLLMAVVGGLVAWLRDSGSGITRHLVPLLILLGLAVSVAGIVMLAESPRQKLKGNRRLSRTFFWYGLTALLLGLPGSILLGIVMVFVAHL